MDVLRDEINGERMKYTCRGQIETRQKHFPLEPNASKNRVQVFNTFKRNFILC